jgi:hypothetical protein
LPGNGFNGGRSLSSALPSYPHPQPPASDTNSSQQPNRSSLLTDYSPTNSLHSTSLNCTELNSVGRVRLQHLFYCCVTSPWTSRVPLLRAYGPLPSNESTCQNILEMLQIRIFAEPRIPDIFKHLKIWSENMETYEDEINSEIKKSNFFNLSKWKFRKYNKI